MSASKLSILASLYRGVERDELARLMRRYRQVVDNLSEYGEVYTLKAFWLRRYSLCYVELKRRQDARRTNKLRNNVW